MALNDPATAADETSGAVALIHGSGLFNMATVAAEVGRPGRSGDLVRDYLDNAELHDLRTSAWFDPAWYRERVARPFSGAPLLHYLRVGRVAGLGPNPLFSPQFYRGVYGALLAPMDDPFTHYRDKGWRLGWRPHALFNPHWYAMQAEIHGEAVGDTSPLLHYIERGSPLGLSPSPYFSQAAYRALHGDVADTEDALLHYLSVGARAGRDPHRLFDTAFYERACGGRRMPDGALVDYVLHGARSGASPHPRIDTDAYRRIYAGRMLADDPLLDLILTAPREHRFASLDGATAAGLSIVARALHPIWETPVPKPCRDGVLHVRDDRRGDVRRSVDELNARLRAANRRSSLLVVGAENMVWLEIGCDRIAFELDDFGSRALLDALDGLDLGLVHYHCAVEPSSPLATLSARLGCPSCISVNGDPGLGRQGWMRSAVRIVAPSKAAADEVERQTGVNAVVRPPPASSRAVASAVPPSEGRLIRIACPDASSTRESAAQLSACAMDAASRDLPLRFVVAGEASDPVALQASETVEVAPPGSGVRRLIEDQPCHAALLLGRSSAVFNTAAAEAMAAGLYPIAVDLGAAAQQLRDAGWGRRIPTTMSATAINDLLLDLPVFRTPPPPGLVIGRVYRDIVADYYGPDLLPDRRPLAYG